MVRRQCQLIYEVSARIEARPLCHRCIVTTRALAVETAGDSPACTVHTLEQRRSVSHVLHAKITETFSRQA